MKTRLAGLAVAGFIACGVPATASANTGPIGEADCLAGRSTAAYKYHHTKTRRSTQGPTRTTRYYTGYRNVWCAYNASPSARFWGSGTW